MKPFQVDGFLKQNGGEFFKKITFFYLKKIKIVPHFLAQFGTGSCSGMKRDGNIISNIDKLMYFGVLILVQGESPRKRLSNELWMKAS